MVKRPAKVSTLYLGYACTVIVSDIGYFAYEAIFENSDINY
jgi:hypothetical protein